jgi:RND family efflux transporter MFP subunit
MQILIPTIQPKNCAKMNSFTPLSGFTRGSLLLLTIATLTSCRPAEPTANASQGQGTPVKLAVVSSSVVDNGEEFVATLESRQSVELKPRAAGEILKIFVRAGDAVAEGDPIMQIDAREQVASVTSKATEIESARAGALKAQAGEQRAEVGVQRAKANLANAQATLKNYEADRKAKEAELKLSQWQFERYQQLNQEGAVSAQTLAQYENSLAAAKANLAALDARIQAQAADVSAQRAEIQAQQTDVVAQQAEIDRAQRQIQQAQANTQEEQARLRNYTVVAPFTGTVGQVIVKVGDYVSNVGGAGTVLATLTQNDALEVNIPVPIEKAARLGIGTRVDLSDEKGKQIGSSRIFFISPKASTESQSVLVKARIENPSGKLRADQQLRARVIWQRQPGVMVSKLAIVPIAGQNFVYVAETTDKGLVAKQKPVKLGVIRGNDQQVIDGLKAGDKVVTSGIQKIQDGAPIAPEP